MRALLLALLIICASTVPATADRYSLRYDGATMGVLGLGSATLDADVTDRDYQITASLRSGGIAALFERTRIQVSASGLIDAAGVRWRAYDLDHHYSRKRRVVAMRVGEDGAVNSVITPDYRLWGDPRTTPEQQRASRDPLSSLIAMAIDVGRSRRCAGAYPTFDGRFHYRLELSRGEIDDFDGGGFEGQVLKCRMDYVAVAGYERRDRGRRRVPHGEVWFALAPDSNFAPPVRISTPLSAGGATIRLTEWRRVIVDVQTDVETP